MMQEVGQSVTVQQVGVVEGCRRSLAWKEESLGPSADF